MSKDLRIILVGKPGVGKSASGNTILGREEFEAGASSTFVTAECQRAKGEESGRPLFVIDTPGLLGSKYAKEEIKKCISLSLPGPHVFLVVLQLGRFTQEEQETVKLMKKIFGEKSANYTMVLFSHGERLKNTTIEEFLSKDKDLAEFTAQCQGGCHVFKNEDPGNRSQVTELLKKIDYMVALNGGGFYTADMLGEEELEELIESYEVKKNTTRPMQEGLLNNAQAHKNTVKGAVAAAMVGTIGGTVTGFTMGGVVGACIGAVVGLVGGGGLGAAVGATVSALLGRNGSPKSR